MENDDQSSGTNVPTQTKIKNAAQNFWDIIKFAVIALVIVIPIRMFIAQPFVVSGESMFPTFNDGEYLIVDEISYNLGTPHRGDVVVFRYPNDPKRFFIKRIIGLPNEEIEINNGQIIVKNKEKPNGFILDESYINEPFFTTGTYKTGDGEYFVLGDNRNRSSDSRFWGMLPEDMLIGRAYLRLLPLKNISYLPGKINN